MSPIRLNNKKLPWLVALFLVFTIAILGFVRDRFLTAGVVSCGEKEGSHPRIDLRQFETNYTAYSISLDAEVQGKGKIAGKVEPAVLQKLSESIQVGQEFRKALVAGYNACAVTRDVYQSAVLRFQSLDGIARQIQALAAKPTLGGDESNSMAKLVDQYIKTSQALGGSDK